MSVATLARSAATSSRRRSTPCRAAWTSSWPGDPLTSPTPALLAHLRRERDALFSFLGGEGIPATNHEAERAIRPLVCARKNWGGNKTWRGARFAAVLGSINRTANQQGVDPLAVLAELARSDGAHCGLPRLGLGPDP